MPRYWSRNNLGNPRRSTEDGAAGRSELCLKSEGWEHQQLLFLEHLLWTRQTHPLSLQALRSGHIGFNILESNHILWNITISIYSSIHSSAKDVEPLKTSSTKWRNRWWKLPPSVILVLAAPGMNKKSVHKQSQQPHHRSMWTVAFWSNIWN